MLAPCEAAPRKVGVRLRMLQVLSSLSRVGLRAQTRRGARSYVRAASRSVNSNKSESWSVSPRREMSNRRRGARANAHCMRVCATRYEKEREIYWGLVVVSSGPGKRSRVRRLRRPAVLSVSFRHRMGDNPEKIIQLILGILRASVD